MGVSSKLITNHNHQRTDTFIKKPAVYLQSQLVIASCMQCVWYVQALVESVQLCVMSQTQHSWLIGDLIS